MRDTCGTTRHATLRRRFALCECCCCDCTRFYKLHTKGLCEVIPMTVPRKVSLFRASADIDTDTCTHNDTDTESETDIDTDILTS